MAIKPAAEPRMSVRAVIIKVSCPAIHAVACGTSNPKILAGNDKSAMLPQFDPGCDVLATRQPRNPFKQNTSASCPRLCEQENSSQPCISVILPNGPIRR